MKKHSNQKLKYSSNINNQLKIAQLKGQLETNLNNKIQAILQDSLEIKTNNQKMNHLNLSYKV